MKGKCANHLATEAPKYHGKEQQGLAIRGGFLASFWPFISDIFGLFLRLKLVVAHIHSPLGFEILLFKNLLARFVGRMPKLHEIGLT